MRNCAGCYSLSCTYKGVCNAKAADAALDTVSKAEPVKLVNPVKPRCPECKLNLYVDGPLSDGTSYYCCNLNCSADAFVPATEPVKAEPTNQMYQSMKATFAKCLSISERKSADYARGENPYRNFETVTRIGVSVQQGILIRTLDKITRLENLLTVAPYVTEETFEDTIDDAINYLAILKARREFERTN